MLQAVSGDVLERRDDGNAFGYERCDELRARSLPYADENLPPDESGE